MSDPFEESPWGDQVSISAGESGASSIHGDVKEREEEVGGGGVGGGDVVREEEEEGIVKDVHEDNNSTINSNINSNVDDLIGGGEVGEASSSSGGAVVGTKPSIASSGLFDSDDTPFTSSIKTPERPSGKSRVTPRRINNRSRKVITQPVFEEGSNDPLGPLGPLGPVDSNDSSGNQSNIDEVDAVSARLSGTGLSPVKDRAVPGSGSLFQDVPLNYSTSEDGNGGRIGNDGSNRSIFSDATGSGAAGGGATVGTGTDTTTESPDFQISIFDPIKVGDITSAHTVYTVHCKTNSPNFSKSEMAVTRRYRDFRWVFHALEHNNPGVIIPPPPDKQAVGRFNEDFVEHRRAALETMLKKIAAHPILKNDPDFRLFLESEAFSNDIKNRVMSNEEVDAVTGGSTTGGGFMNTLGGAFSFSAKFIETSQWFIDKKEYLDSLESQLKSLNKALDLVVNQRRELSDVTGEFALVLEALADVEISKSLSELLISFSESQTRIQNLYSRQCLQDILSLSTTIDEYLRLISSIRSVFLQRQKSYFSVQSAEHELTKKQSHLDKLHKQGKTLQDKIAILQKDVEQQEKKVFNQRVAFDDISKRIVVEFDRIEHERIHDFRNSVELFLENAVESQKEAIEVWETFYQRNFVANRPPITA